MSGPEAVADCMFCGIVAGDVPATIVRETPRLIAFRDIDPQAPTHVLLVPRAHYASVAELAGADPDVLAELVREAATVAADEGHSAYRLVFNTGAEAGQSVFHVHGHVLAGRPLAWPPG
ncbi:MAG: histidine triad family protein [Actinomycetota bacterium]|jgi:histidine triad (HIT) family protein|nr:histidine triad family protein [Actinomycetota bacterium]